MEGPSTNVYINKYATKLNACETDADFKKFYSECSAAIASLILGKGYNEPFDEYLNKLPSKREFYNWWMAIKDTIIS